MSLTNIKKPQSVLQAVAEFDRLGRAMFLRKHGFRRSRSYFLKIGDRRYDSKAIIGAAHGYEFPDKGPLKPSDFSGGDATVRRKLEQLHFEVLVPPKDASSAHRPGSAPLLDQTDHEREQRFGMWDQLLEAGGPRKVAPGLLRTLRMYGGAQGIWVDKKRTGKIGTTGNGVTVGVLHTGASYADDLSEEAILYHYPETDRPPARDSSEIEATKEAHRLRLPVFVVTYPSPGSSVRNVSLGWVEDWDDNAGTFLIGFGEGPPPSRAEEEAETEDEFYLTEDRRSAKRLAPARVGQQRFKFRVLKRYGTECAVCSMSVQEVLEAAHIRPKQDKGSDDPRNGLVLCANHHRAFDAGLFTIEPHSLALTYQDDGPGQSDLGIRRRGLDHLANRPHPKALEWRWRRWSASAGDRGRT